MKRKPEVIDTPKKLIGTLIAVTILTPIVFTVQSGGDIPFIFAVLLTAAADIFVVCTYFWGKRADKQADRKKHDYLDGSYFSTAEWREKYLRYTIKHPFSRPERTMKADIARYYRKNVSIPFALFGLFMLVGSGCGVYMGEIFVAVGGFAVGLLILWVAVEPLFARPLKAFYRRTDIDHDAAERSYDGGELLTYKKGGICIGSEYTVIFEPKNVFAVRNRDITSVSRRIVRQSSYMNGTYAGDEYLHKVEIFTDVTYSLELNEYQVEMVITALRRYAQPDSNKYGESLDYEVVV